MNVIQVNVQTGSVTTRPYTAEETAAAVAATAGASVPTVPPKVTRRQARQALLLSNKLALVQPAIDAIADPVQRQMIQIEWDDSQDFERQRPTLIALATAIGLTAQDLDDLFIQAAAL